MATHDASDTDDEFHSMSVSADDGESEGEPADDDSESVMDMTPPSHPIATLQGAFEESIVESAAADTDFEFDSDQQYNAEMRRRELLAAKRYEEAKRITRWKQNQRRGNYHPYLKLISQIVFGMHLLQQRQAKSNEEVVKILQNHVNEIDSFLERTSDDFDLSSTDIEERIRYLKLPMQHMEVFQTMLDEKQFRTDLLKGNEKIEKIVGRSVKALNDSLQDVQTGLRSTRELRQYLNSIERRWPSDDADIAEVFAAMRGNEQGWLRFLKDLQYKGETLNNQLVELSTVSSDISKLAGAASRRNLPQSRTMSPTESGHSDSSNACRSKFSKEGSASRKPGPWLGKPLPKEPDSRTGTIHVAMPKPHPVPFETRFERPREQAPVPGSQDAPSSSRPLSKTSVQNSILQAARDEPRDRPDYTRNAGPLRSHPPDQYNNGASSVPTRKPVRSQSQAAIEMPNTAQKKSTKSRFSRSRASNAHAKSSSTSAPRITSGVLRAQTDIRLVPKEAGTKPADLDLKPSIATGFSRRLSTKLRNLPPPIKSTRDMKQEPIARPIDSGYSAEGKRSMSSPTTNYTTTMTDREPEKQMPPEPAKDSRPATRENNNPPPGSRLGLFPKTTTGPLTPSQASMQSKEYFPSPNSKLYDSSVDTTPRTMHSSKPSRTMSIRKFFHRKGDSRNVLAT